MRHFAFDCHLQALQIDTLPMSSSIAMATAHPPCSRCCPATALLSLASNCNLAGPTLRGHASVTESPARYQAAFHSSVAFSTLVHPFLLPYLSRRHRCGTAQRKQLNLPQEKRNGFLLMPWRSTVTPPPAWRPPQFLVKRKGIFPSSRLGWSGGGSCGREMRVVVSVWGLIELMEDWRIDW